VLCNKAREQYYLDEINPSLNTCNTAVSPLGIKRDINFSINLSNSPLCNKAREEKVKIYMNKLVIQLKLLKMKLNLKYLQGVRV
jgi:hypothetical protein